MKLFTLLLLLGCLSISAVNCRGHVAEIFEMGGNINEIDEHISEESHSPEEYDPLPPPLPAHLRPKPIRGPVTWNKPIKIADMLQDRMGHQNLDLPINAGSPESIM